MPISVDLLSNEYKGSLGQSGIRKNSFCSILMDYAQYLGNEAKRGKAQKPYAHNCKETASPAYAEVSG